MEVLKFGGTSVANAENIQKAVSIIRVSAKNKQIVVIVSALGGTTDRLIEVAKLAASGDEGYKEHIKAIEERHLQLIRDLLPFQTQSSILSQVKKMCNELEKTAEGIFLLKELTARILDQISGYGELLSSTILSSFMHSLDMKHQWLDSRELIRTDSNHGMAEVNFSISNSSIRKAIDTAYFPVYLAPGFIASDGHGVATTLGRGGSDYSAAIFAAALGADSLEIWTDVDGMMTADPRLVKDARSIPLISYMEAMELSHFGAKVIYPPTMKPVLDSKIPVRIKNTFFPEHEGTLIGQTNGEVRTIFRGISSISGVALLSLQGSGMVGTPGISAKLFEALSTAKINVIFITQCSSEQSICFAVDEPRAAEAKQVADTMFRFERSSGKVEPVNIEIGLSVIALVGDKMKNHPGISGRMFSALGRNGININAIAQGSSERNITVIIRSEDLRKALNVLHEEFFETSLRQLNLYIAGLGNVGSRLLDQLGNQQKHLRDVLKVDLRIRGLINSRKMILAEESIDPDDWKAHLESGVTANLQEFIAYAKQRNRRNSIFIDVTASKEVAMGYKTLLGNSISVVACNKIACSSAYVEYKNLKETARDYQAAFLFETNVGAGLPVIGTLNDLVRSGDRIKKMEAVLSGTLNYVFNHYDGSHSFASVVRKAQEEGYTEPDPRTDLSGQDVVRKILILAREAGHVLEQEEVQNTGFMPASCMEGDVDHFYKQLELHETHFKSIYQKAASKKCKLRFVANFTDGKVSVGLQHIAADQDLYQLNGKDNVVVFYTNRYDAQPLVIKGAGAGAAVTASGIFGDIIRAGNIH